MSRFVVGIVAIATLAGCAEAVLVDGLKTDAAREEIVRETQEALGAPATKGSQDVRLISGIASGQTSVADLDGAQYVYWTFEANAGEDITLVAEGAGDPGLDTVLFLYRATADGELSGRYLRYNDDFGGALSSRIEHTIAADGNYAAVIRRYDRARTGSVTLYFEVAGREVACGARLGNTCAADEFCDFSIGAICGWADATGVCRTRPEICTREYAPVCGCDNVTYSNGCTANAAGQAFWQQGACEEDLANEGDECSLERGCAAGLVCGGLSYGDTGWCVSEELAGTFTSNEVLAIPDMDAAGVESTIVVTGLASVPLDIRIHVDITHTWRGDLKVTLRDPGGQVVVLHDRTGGSADNLIIDGPVSGFSMDDMVNGPWTLTVSDHAGQDVGQLNSWSLELISRWD